MKEAIVLLIIFSISSCSNKLMQNNVTQPPAGVLPEFFDKQGHRGCRGLMPENTIPAMLHALDLNVTTLELDVVITKDKQVVVSHEPFFNHDISTKPNGKAVNVIEEKGLNIFQMTYEQVKTYDVGLKPHPRFPQQKKIAAVKPLLRDLFDSVSVYLQSHARPKPCFA